MANMKELDAKISVFAELHKRISNVQNYIKEVMDFPFAEPESPVYDIWWERPDTRFLITAKDKTSELMQLVDTFLNGLKAAEDYMKTEAVA